MGRKAKRMNARQAREALAAAMEAFKAFNSVCGLLYDNHPKNSRIVRKYHTTWLHLQGFQDLMELEVERSFLV